MNLDATERCMLITESELELWNEELKSARLPQIHTSPNLFFKEKIDRFYSGWLIRPQGHVKFLESKWAHKTLTLALNGVNLNNPMFTFGVPLDILMGRIANLAADHDDEDQPARNYFFGSTLWLRGNGVYISYHIFDSILEHGRPIEGSNTFQLFKTSKISLSEYSMWQISRMLYGSSDAGFRAEGKDKGDDREDYSMRLKLGKVTIYAFKDQMQPEKFVEKLMELKENYSITSIPLFNGMFYASGTVSLFVSLLPSFIKELIARYRAWNSFYEFGNGKRLSTSKVADNSMTAYRKRRAEFLKQLSGGVYP